MKKKIIAILLTLLAGGAYYYLFLPPINIKSSAFYTFIIFLILLFGVLNFSLSTKIYSVTSLNRNSFSLKGFTPLKFSFIGTGLIILLIILVNFILSPFFNSKIYKNRIDIDRTSSFEEDVAEINLDALPIIDKDSSRKLGDRVMGELPELVSQFRVSDLYTQINYNTSIIRVTPLEYSDFFKWFGNKEEGTSGYISVNSVTGEAKLMKTEGLKYMPSAYFSKNLSRKLRFTYPTKIFDKAKFEINDEGKPFWIIPTVTYVGVDLIKEVNGVITLDPNTGDSTFYEVENAPLWIDHVYPSELVLEQIDQNGIYNDGFLNSIFGQKNVVTSTRGYNYTVMNNDVYLYTGITSVIGDESNIGFILTNLRTKKTNFYSAPGAEEYSAMGSAEGQVQQMNYISTFPLLVNVNNKPTYFVSLKDRAGLVKMYGFVDVRDYQKVVVTDSSLGIENSLETYLKNNKVDIYNEITINVSSLKEFVIDGNTNVYITGTEGNKFIANIENILDIYTDLKVNETYIIEYSTKNDLNYVNKIRRP